MPNDLPPDGAGRMTRQPWSSPTPRFPNCDGVGPGVACPAVAGNVDHDGYVSQMTELPRGAMMTLNADREQH